jgi:hypothetical protein
MSIQTDRRSAEQLNEELAAIDVDLARLAEQDNGVCKLLADYAKISTTMARLADLGATRISGELAKANTRRALMAALIPIRNDLELKLLPPGERRTFSDLVRIWSASIEQAINRNDPQEVPTPVAAETVSVVEQAQA